MKLFKNKISVLLIISVISFLIAFSLKQFNNFDRNCLSTVSSFEKTLLTKENKTEKVFAQIRKDNKNGFYTQNLVPEYFNDLFNKKGLLFLVYENDSLKYWSHNAIPVFNYYDKNIFENNFVHLKNAWFEVKKQKINNQIITGLILIKTDYCYRNDYLINRFQNAFKISSKANISTKKGLYNIHNKNKDFLFSLQFDKCPEISGSKTSAIILFYILSILCFISFLFYFNKSCFHNKKTFLLAFISELILLRIIQFYFKFPIILYETSLFSPFYYANSSLLPSLGDFLINSLLIIYISILIFISIKQIGINKLKMFLNIPVKRYIYSFLSFSAVFILFFVFVYLFKGLIINSNISFNLNNFFSLSCFSFTGLFIISVLLFSFFFISNKLCEIVCNILSAKSFYYTLLITTILFVFITFFSKNFEIIYLIVPIAFIVSFWYFKFYDKKITNNFLFIAFFLILFSLFSTYLLYKNNDIKEEESRKSLAIKLSTKKDPIGEYLFQDIENKIKKDNIVIEYLKRAPVSDEQTIKYIKQKYFTSYWAKYRLQITICKNMDSLFIKPEYINVNCNNFFNEIIENIGQPSSSKNLFYLNDGSEQNNYIAKFIFFENTDTLLPVSLFIELNSKFITKDLGYPKLLTNKRINENTNFTDYSYAKYKNGILINQFGKYFYNINIDSLYLSNAEFSFFNKDDFSHLLYKTDNHTNLIISKKNKGFLYIIAPFPFFLIIFFITYILILILIRKFFLIIENIKSSFKTQLELYIILIVVASFAISASSLFYFNTINKNKNNKIITEKTHSILIEVEHKLSNYKELTPEMYDYISDLLIKFSNVFFIDINLYDLNGNLIASSRPEIFTKGLVSAKINTIAFNKLSATKKTLFINKEKIGNLEYLSSYTPFINNQSKIIAYLNLPYFAKQSEFQTEISNFFIASINIYFILIILSLFITFPISNYITLPLKLIQKKIGKIKLGGKNEKIEWSKNDEIGSLITEYNKMIDELSESAELLAKSERESAWREMAKQVAHEIKNPLTPMKLSVQYLQKAWEEKTPNWDKKLKHFTNTLIEQIDTLSTIATEFSGFAKTPQQNNKKLELSKLISYSIGLFKNLDNISINLKTEKINNHVFADREQLLRVFNNLIKNSIQAIDKKQKGIIDISIKTQKHLNIIIVSDNGSGIHKDQLDKVFLPNFTTKTSGMGLGLAMVKSIIENSNGKIWFKSKENTGTTFYISLPVYNK
jgi:signal transduction histidine kinase